MSVALLVFVFAGKGGAAEHGKIKHLPAPIAQTIKEKFPGATVVGFVMEREPGVRYYEVNLRRGEDRIEVEVAPDGSIGEIESRVALEGLPEAHQARIREAVGRGKIHRVEKHVRVGRGRNGTFAPLKSPVGFYEVKYYDDDRRRAVKVPIDPDQIWVVDDEDDDEQEK
ncbi:MAG: hypothetical protein ACYTBX_20400 [Planctomycetota bacterium]